jgi:hypothetical protein
VPPAAEPLTAGAIWRDMLAALRPDFGTLFAVTAPFTLLVGMALTLFGPPVPETLEQLTPKNLLILGLLPNIVGAIGQLAVVRLLLRPGETAGRALGTALVALPAWAAAALVTALPVGIGFVLLILPGIYLLARLFLVAPVLVIERTGAFTAISRSWALTADSAWQLVLLFVLGLLFILGASLLAGGLGGAIGSVLLLAGSKGAADFAAALVPALLSTLVAMGSAAAAAVAYRRLAG